ncbi:MAG: alginate export family protein [Bryobacterales bacterium]|nr:alginate export family protein [Bryobacterales bacterium]
MNIRNFRASRARIGLLAALSLMPICALAEEPPEPSGAASGYAASKLPAWLWFSGEERVRVESLHGAGFQPGRDTYPLQRLRLKLGIRARPWLRFAFEGQDSRVFLHDVSPAPASLRNPMDLRQGYVEIGDAETGWISVRAGRQPLHFGEGRLMEDSDWSNTGRTFDAARLTLRGGPIRLDVFSGAPVEVNRTGFDEPAGRERLHGLYGSIEKWIPNATVEPYLLWRRMDLGSHEGTAPGWLDSKTTGFRWAGILPRGFDYEIETMMQRGRKAHQTISAWGSYWTLGYTRFESRYRPRFFMQLDRGSGDRNPNDGVYGGFSTLYSAADDGYDTASLFGGANVMHARPGATFQLKRSLALTLAYHSYWRVSELDGLYNGPGQIIVAPSASQGRHIGQGSDLQAAWKPGRYTSVGLTYGRLMPGEFLRRGGHGFAYNYLFLSVTQRF